MKELSENVKRKVENGILLEGKELTELCDFNEEFFTEKERIAMEEINRLGGIDKLADDLDKRMRKAEESQQ